MDNEVVKIEDEELEYLNAKAIIPIITNKELKTKLDYLNNLDHEIGGWITGKVTKECIILENILIPNQEVTNASVEIEPESGVKLLKEFKDKCKKILGHYHSHAGMGVFWSTTDEENMAKIMLPRDFFIFIVGSNEKYLVRLETKKPFRMSVDNLKIRVYNEEDKKIQEKLQKIIDKRITQTTISATSFAQLQDDRISSIEKGDLLLEESSSNNHFWKEIFAGIFVSYQDSILLIEGLNISQANSLAHEFSDYQSQLGGPGGLGLSGYYVEFTVNKLKKAKRLVNKIVDALNSM